MATKKKRARGGAEVAPEASYKPRPPMEERRSGWDEWELRDALRTLASAKKIRGNSALMRAVRREALNQLKAAQATAKSIGD